MEALADNFFGEADLADFFDDLAPFFGALDFFADLAVFGAGLGGTGAVFDASNLAGADCAGVAGAGVGVGVGEAERVSLGMTAGDTDLDGVNRALYWP